MPYMIGALPMGEQSPASLSGLKLLGNNNKYQISKHANSTCPFVPLVSMVNGLFSLSYIFMCDVLPSDQSFW